MAESNPSQPQPPQPQPSSINQPDVAQPSSQTPGTATPASVATGATASPQTHNEPQPSQAEVPSPLHATGSETQGSKENSLAPEQPVATSSNYEAGSADISREPTGDSSNAVVATQDEIVTPAPIPNSNNISGKEEEQDVIMGGTEPEAENAPEAAADSGMASATGATGATGASSHGLHGVDPVITQSKKDTSLKEFLGQMDEYAPIIPDAVTAHYLAVAGLPPPGSGPNRTPPHLARLLALATQKFIADIAADAYQYSRIRSSNSASSNNPMGSINITAGLANQAAAAQSGGGASTAGTAGGAGATGGEGTAKGKANTSGLHLGVQRSGFGGGGHGGSQGRAVLTMEDLGMAVGEYGVSVKRGEFYR
ncbi:hypothetical protein FQN57_003211 [Myotisia sp. PD_48]|nr:hypothetical protein FQN57_003211 [Myotisia sp. PD_48]